MKNIRTLIVASLIACALLSSLCAVGFYPQAVSAESNKPRRSKDEKLSDTLRQGIKNDETVQIILQLNGSPTGRLNALLQRNGIRVKDNFAEFNSLVIELPLSVASELSGFDEVEFISLDRDVHLFGHVEQTTGAAYMRTQSGNSGLKGDPYGHGTHVASLAAGVDHVAHGAYTGVAPESKIINLRVLNTQGVGAVSNVLRALNWILAPVDPNKPLGEKNYQKYKIKVVNLSLGAPAVDSYKDDPLCLAARRLVNTGIVVVAAAGNDGTDVNGRKIYGRIHAPGNDPSLLALRIRSARIRVPTMVLRRTARVVQRAAIERLMALNTTII
jgi:subtilisin family serine protease